MNIQRGFTLAETLITIGIIGIVAALTILAIIQKHKKTETTAKLKKFYSTMYQAIIMSENENGSIEDWEKAEMDIKDEETGEYSDNDFVHSEEFFNKYLKKYIKYLKTEKDEKTKLFKVILPDSSSITFRNGSCMDLIFDTNGNTKPNEEGRDQYRFLICQGINKANNKNFSAYIRSNTKTRDERLTSCKNNAIYCSGLLEYDNWEFQKDYPYRL